MKIVRQCFECGKTYERYPSQLGKFCSLTCFYDSHHVDGDRLNNAASNLVVFPSQAAHMAHHASTTGVGRNRIKEEQQ